jgi:hypothetical protein
MALSFELESFVENWRAKAHAYPDSDIRGAFDRFFTLYVAFNRLYAEATFRLGRRGQVKLRDRFPDSQAAQEYVVQYCGALTLIQSWEQEADTTASIQQIAEHLRERRFALKLDIVTGERNRDADLELLAGLESRSKNHRAQSVLEALYAIRCNMFHGHKDFEPIQLQLLRPAIVILESTINVLHRSLSVDGG